MEWEKEAPFDRSLGEGHASLTEQKKHVMSLGA